MPLAVQHAWRRRLPADPAAAASIFQHANMRPLPSQCNKHGTHHMHSTNMRPFATRTCCCVPGAAQPLPAAAPSQRQPAPWLLPGRQLPQRGVPHCPAAWSHHGACRHHQTSCPSLQVSSSSTRVTDGLPFPAATAATLAPSSLCDKVTQHTAHSAPKNASKATQLMAVNREGPTHRCSPLTCDQLACHCDDARKAPVA